MNCAILVEVEGAVTKQRSKAYGRVKFFASAPLRTRACAPHTRVWRKTREPLDSSLYLNHHHQNTIHHNYFILINFIFSFDAIIHLQGVVLASD